MNPDLRRRTDELCTRLTQVRDSLDIAGKTAVRDQLEAKQAEGDFWNNPEKAKSVIGQLKVCNALLKPYEELTAAANDIKAMAELAEEDAAFESELEPALQKAETQYEAFELQIMMGGKHDSRSAIVTIKPGAGGTDACDFAEMLFRAYGRWAQRHGFSIEDEDIEPNQEAGVASVSFKIIGPYAYGYMQSEIGVHRLVRISPFGGGDTRQTSFAAIDVLPELPDDIEIVIKDTDYEVQTFSTGGPGGQHVNKTQSGVRLIHKSGIRAECRMGRSQHKNKAEALKMLQTRLEAVEEQKRMGDAVKSYDAKGEIAFGSQIRSYVLQPYTLVRDERDGIDVKTPAVNDVLDGDFDQFMHAYLRHKAAKSNKVKAK
ncbi:peptide chain release factor 2 [Gemmata sp. JC717]|uniref:Peptide chain release factor 2 n=1 Tax=Gemmata algarum TaxID=2975278 RepID=A0ABU5EYT2_9BACT|nr:peptide chain release factor 2 [Gemmata algarum]MDY3555354.1 peptide chain release factor 2 [Gemmata algarum]MDY3560078.1 peptide chain release factor 2 [Gemmata algarum]